MKVPVTIYANESLITKMVTDRTIDQAANVATLPGVKKHVVVLPDGHEGYGFPVGGVAATDMEHGVISPGGVGYDINCGVRLVRTNLTESDIRPRLKDLVNELFRSIPSGVGSEGAVKLSRSELDELLVEGVRWAVRHGYGTDDDAEVCEEGGSMAGADPASVSDTARKRGAPQLGSLGSGNHFLEVQKVDRIVDERAAKALGLDREGQLTVLIHCGSRGFGHQICTDYLRVSESALRKYGLTLADRELACVPNNSKEGGNLITTVAFGIPSTVVMAILLGAFLILRRLADGQAAGLRAVGVDRDLGLAVRYLADLGAAACARPPRARARARARRRPRGSAAAAGCRRGGRGCLTAARARAVQGRNAPYRLG